MRRLALLLTLCAAALSAQSVYEVPGIPAQLGGIVFPTLVVSDPTGGCTNQSTLLLSLASGHLFTCFAGTYVAASGGGAAGAFSGLTGNISTAQFPTGALNNQVVYYNGTNWALGQLSFGQIAGAATLTQLPTGYPWANVANSPQWVPLADPLTTLGDTLYGGASGVLTRLAGDTSNLRKFQMSMSTGGAAQAPVWSLLTSADIPNNAANTSGQSGTALALAALPTPCSGGQVPTGILANGNSTGCATVVTAGSQTAHYVLAAPSGSSGTPGYRLLIAGDLPSIPISQISGSLAGDVTGTPAATVVATVGTSTAANVHSAELLANAATSADTGSTLVKRDVSGNITVSAVTVSSASAGQLAVCAPSSTTNCIATEAASPPTQAYTYYLPFPTSGTSAYYVLDNATQSLTNKTLVGPTVENGAFTDANNSQAIQFEATTSGAPTAAAGNYPDLVYSAAGTGVTLAAAGSDTNIPLYLNSKGSSSITALANFNTNAALTLLGAFTTSGSSVTVNLSGAIHTQPVATGATNPATCVASTEFYINSGTGLFQRCGASNVWAQAFETYGAVAAGIATQTSPTINGPTVTNLQTNIVEGSGTHPTCTVNLTNVPGVSPTCTVTGSNLAFDVAFFTGSSGTAPSINTQILTINWATGITTPTVAPYCVWSISTNKNSAVSSAWYFYRRDSTISGGSPFAPLIYANNTALTINTTYNETFICMQANN